MDAAAPDGSDKQEAGQSLDELQRVIDTALAYLSLDDLLPELLDRIIEIFAADTAAFLLLDPEARRARTPRAAKGHRGGGRAGRPIPLGSGFAGRIAAERRPVSAPTSSTPTSSTRSCARRASAACSAYRC